MCGKNKKQIGTVLWDDFVNRGTRVKSKKRKYKKQKGKGLSSIARSINPGPFSPPIKSLPWWNQRGYGVGDKFVKGWNWLARNVPGLNKKHTKRLRRKKVQKSGFLGRLLIRSIMPKKHFVNS